jgi:hypothetical protein
LVGVRQVGSGLVRRGSAREWARGRQRNGQIAALHRCHAVCEREHVSGPEFFKASREAAGGGEQASREQQRCRGDRDDRQ